MISKLERICHEEKLFFYNGKPLPFLYREYMNHLRSTKGLTIGTIHNRKKPVLSFFIANEKYSTRSGIQKIKPAQIHDYVTETAMPLKREGKRILTCALRDFFRFLHLRGFIKSDHSKSVPTIIAYRLTSIQRGLSWDIIRKLLQNPDRRTHTGRRDYALLLMLARYGIRQGQLINLLMSDIDWKNETVFFKAAKGGKDVKVPLLPDVAEAILAYIKGGRKDAPKKYTQVFLTLGRGGSAVDGQRPLQDLGGMVNKRLKQIGIHETCPFPRGPHSIRHAFATKLLEEKKPMKTISDLLGHKSIRTTFIYTKSDMKRLRELTVKWPERSVA